MGNDLHDTHNQSSIKPHPRGRRRTGLSRDKEVVKDIQGRSLQGDRMRWLSGARQDDCKVQCGWETCGGDVRSNYIVCRMRWNGGIRQVYVGESVQCDWNDHEDGILGRKAEGYIYTNNYNQTERIANPTPRPRVDDNQKAMKMKEEG